MDVINFIASIFSIIGAIVAWVQFKKAKTASQAAISAKDFIITRKNTIDLNELLKDAKSIESIVINYTIVSETKAMGRNWTKDLKSIQLFLSKLNEIKAHIDEDQPIKEKLNDRYNTIHKYSQELNVGNTSQYKTLLIELRSLISVLSTEINKNFFL